VSINFYSLQHSSNSPIFRVQGSKLTLLIFVSFVCLCYIGFYVLSLTDRKIKKIFWHLYAVLQKIFMIVLVFQYNSVILQPWKA